jgi:hypothetical protein
MSWVAVAIGGSALLGVGATFISGNQAQKATEGATNAAISEQDKMLAYQQSVNAPYQALATGGGNNIGAIQQYENLLGLNPSVNPQAALAATPGYQFAQQQGLSSTVNQASAMGLGLSGNTLESLDKFSTGLADQTYQSAVGNASTAVRIGQSSAANQAAAAANTGNTVSGALINQGNNIAGIDANIGASIAKAGSGATTNYISTLQGLNNPMNQIPISAGSDPGMTNYGPYTVNTPGGG